MKAFLRGLHIAEHKEGTEHLPIVKAAIPKKVIIPLQQHTGAPCTPLVNVGDEVIVGQKIGEMAGYVSAPVHASISGKVTKIERVYHPCGGQLLSIMIEAGEVGREAEKPIAVSRNIESVSPEEIRNIVKEAGIVGLGGAAFPTHVKLSPPRNKPIDTVILNGCECEPFITCDHRVMLERSGEVIEGALLVAKAVGAERIIIAVENNKLDAIEKLKFEVTRSPALAGSRSIINNNGNRDNDELNANISIIKLPTKYPQGGEKMLIKSLLGREVPSGGLPLDVGCLVQNVGTAVAIAEAIKFGKPLIERVVTVTGSGVKKPQNLLARIGASFGDLIEECGGLTADAAKIIMGGPMTGNAVSSPDVSVVKATTCILVLNKREARSYEERACIRCGRCIKACPMGLAPNIIADFAKLKEWPKTEEYHVADCIECGCCAYVCPSRIFLVQYFKTAKKELSRCFLAESRDPDRAKRASGQLRRSICK